MMLDAELLARIAALKARLRSLGIDTRALSWAAASRDPRLLINALVDVALMLLERLDECSERLEETEASLEACEEERSDLEQALRRITEPPAVDDEPAARRRPARRDPPGAAPQRDKRGER